MRNKKLGAFALCAAFLAVNEAGAAAVNEVFDVPAENGIGDVVALTNVLTQATANFNTVRLAPGVYDMTGTVMSPSDHHQLVWSSYGGNLIGTGAKPEDTVILGGGAEDCCRLLKLNKICTVSNLTFACAYAASDTSQSGGVASSSNGTFTDCVFSNNYARNFGGALDQAKTLTRCKFFKNWAGSSGGAMRPWTSGRAVYRDCYFEGNHSPAGGVAYYGATWSNCVFVGNYASNQGCFREQGSYGNILLGCYFTNNLATGGSGSVGQALAATNCVFYGNAANTSGDTLFSIGSVYGCEISCNTGMPLIASATLRNCRIVDNFANRVNSNPMLSGCNLYNCLVARNVGGVHSMSQIANGGMMRNCTIASNRVYCADYSPVSSVLVNTILADNVADSTTAQLGRRQDLHSGLYPAVMTNCLWTAQVGENFDFETRIIGGRLVTTTQLGFTDVEKGDYTIVRKSAARNAGYQDDDYLAMVGPIDLNGDPRVNAGDSPERAIIDIGCYECQIPAPGLMMLVR